MGIALEEDPVFPFCFIKRLFPLANLVVFFCYVSSFTFDLFLIGDSIFVFKFSNINIPYYIPYFVKKGLLLNGFKEELGLVNHLFIWSSKKMLVVAK